MDINTDISSIIVRENDTDDLRYYFKPFNINPEYLSHTVLHSRINIINHLLDAYVYKYRMISLGSEDLDFIEDKTKLIKSLHNFFDSAKEYGIVGYNWEEILNGKSDNKIEEILRWFEIDRDFLSALKTYQEADSTSEKNNIAIDYYNSKGIPYEYDTCYEGTNSWNCISISRPEESIEGYKIKYNNNIYEGKDGIKEFVYDYYNISSNNISDLYDYLYENPW